VSLKAGLKLREHGKREIAGSRMLPSEPMKALWLFSNSKRNQRLRSKTARTEVLRDINLSVERGEFVAIVGYSGAGKTTLLSLIAGLTTPDSGTLTLNDLEITAAGPDRAVVFQTYSLLPG